MSILNSTEPLGLPTGSVRAIIALMITAATLYVYATTGTPPVGLTEIDASVITWYFVTRSDAPLPAPGEELAVPLEGEV